MAHDVRITRGHLFRHAPAKGEAGLEAATIDVAQDLLLRHLQESAVLDDFAFKGGTALRKLFAGKAGRFSTDLDFSVRCVAADRAAVVEELVRAIEGFRCGPFRYGTSERRGKYHVSIASELSEVVTLTCKLDVSAPPWLPPERRAWVPMPIHDYYGGPLPGLHVIRLDENLAEKIARLNRATPARDAYDLVWVMKNRARLGRELDLGLVRRLAVMKAWVDKNGLSSARHTWDVAHEPRPFDVEHWLRERLAEEFDDEFIGLLATPPPSLDELGRSLSAEYAFLRDLTDEERRLAGCSGQERAHLLRMLDRLPDSSLPHGTCW